MVYYAIRHKPTGNYLPQLRRRRGHTHTEPTPLADAVPRLHKTMRQAKVALWYWLKGKWHEEYSQPYYGFGQEYDGNEPKPCPERRRDDMEIVPMVVKLAPLDAVSWGSGAAGCIGDGQGVGG